MKTINNILILLCFAFVCVGVIFRFFGKYIKSKLRGPTADGYFHRRADLNQYLSIPKRIDLARKIISLILLFCAVVVLLDSIFNLKIISAIKDTEYTPDFWTFAIIWIPAFWIFEWSSKMMTIGKNSVKEKIIEYTQIMKQTFPPNTDFSRLDSLVLIHSINEK